jgi:hypothetical protein
MHMHAHIQTHMHVFHTYIHTYIHTYVRTYSSSGDDRSEPHGDVDTEMPDYDDAPNEGPDVGEGGAGAGAGGKRGLRQYDTSLLPSQASQRSVRAKYTEAGSKDQEILGCGFQDSEPYHDISVLLMIDLLYMHMNVSPCASLLQPGFTFGSVLIPLPFYSIAFVC